MSKCLGKAENRRGEVERKEIQHTGGTGEGREKRQQLKLIVQRDDVKLMLKAAKSSGFGERQSWILICLSTYEVCKLSKPQFPHL